MPQERLSIGDQSRAHCHSPPESTGSSITRQFGGMGLGLAIVKQFVDQHNGRISVETEEGAYTRFCVHLPRL